ncbi:hypothetical protein BYT27DRAFT_7174041 [Phlegmacium glaucopus]|nr:hypothetical protein BYT27DRAFT_7174041 [Phlegmacium glaucopus]
MTGGTPELKAVLFRLIFRAAALEGMIFVNQDPVSQKFLSVGACFGPGTRFLGSQAQFELGAEEFFESLPDEAREWWEKFRNPAPAKVENATLGKDKATASWSIIVMATLKTEQGKGHGTVLMKEICRRVLEDNSFMLLNATSKNNVDFYQRLGLEVVSTSESVSSFGTWTNHAMLRDPRKTVPNSGVEGISDIYCFATSSANNPINSTNLPKR